MVYKYIYIIYITVLDVIKNCIPVWHKIIKLYARVQK